MNRLFFSRSITTRALVRSFKSSSLRNGGGHHHHSPDMPPFARLRPPSGKLPEEIELVWDDTVAPETCIDIDAPHVSTSEVLKAIFGAIAFFGTLYTLVSLSDPVKNNPVATRSFVLPPGGLSRDLALAVSAGEDEEEEEEE